MLDDNSYYWVIFCSVLVGIVGLIVFACVQYRRHVKSIAGRHVVVTGGSQGIGMWAAVRAAQLGANVTIVARNAKQLEQAQALIASHRQSDAQHVRTASIDVCADYATVAERLAAVEQAGGPIYMLVNCAGTAVCGTLIDTTIEMARRMMDINYFGTFQPTRCVLAGMRERAAAGQDDGGIIVLTSSMAGMLGVYGMGAYSASKFALRGLAEVLALESAHLGISVTLALPGDTDTPGLAVENESKPAITKAMSSEGGLAQPSEMGRQIIEDALRGNFFSVYDSTAWAVATLCAGLSPWGSWLQALFSAILMPPLKLYSAFLWRDFRALVRREEAKVGK